MRQVCINIDDVPVRVKIGRKLKPLNLNFYRNAHYQTLNRMKAEFNKSIEPSLKKLPKKLKNVTITYTIRPGSKRKFDLSNVGTVVDKFFCDCLVHSGILEDDNYAIVNGVSYVLGTPNTCKDTVVDIEIRGFIYEN